MKPSRCGCGNMRQKKGPMTFTWTLGKRSVSESWMRRLLTRHQLVRALQRLPLQMPQKKSRRKRHPTLLWDQSASQAWASCHGGQTVSCHRSLLSTESLSGGCLGDNGILLVLTAPLKLNKKLDLPFCFPFSFQAARERQLLSRNVFTDVQK